MKGAQHKRPGRQAKEERQKSAYKRNTKILQTNIRYNGKIASKYQIENARYQIERLQEKGFRYS